VAGTRGAAAAEIAAAYEALRTSLAAHQAADALVAAAAVTVTAARKGLDLGLGNLTAAIAAEKDLLEAEEARADTRRDAFDAAASLAFVTAVLTAETPPQTRSTL
jgi:outer membrane protein TolC